MLDHRAIRAVFKLPAWFANCVDSLIPIYLFSPLLYYSFELFFHMSQLLNLTIHYTEIILYNTTNTRLLQNNSNMKYIFIFIVFSNSPTMNTFSRNPHLVTRRNLRMFNNSNVQS